MDIVQVFGQSQVRFVDHPENLFEFGIVASDLAQVLDVQRVNDLASSVDEEWKGTGTIRTLGGKQSMTIIWEPGVYEVLAKSRKPQAKPFKKWLFSEVLPSIRKTGSYTLGGRQSIAGTEARLAGKQSRRTLTDSIKDYIERHEGELSENKSRWLYSNVTNRSYIELFSLQAKKLVEIHGCKKDELRDYLTIEETAFLQALETCAARMIDVEDMYPLDAIKMVSSTMHLKDVFTLTYKEAVKQIKAGEV